MVLRVAAGCARAVVLVDGWLANVRRDGRAVRQVKRPLGTARAVPGIARLRGMRARVADGCAVRGRQARARRAARHRADRLLRVVRGDGHLRLLGVQRLLQDMRAAQQVPPLDGRATRSGRRRADRQRARRVAVVCSPPASARGRSADAQRADRAERRRGGSGPPPPLGPRARHARRRSGHNGAVRLRHQRRQALRRRVQGWRRQPRHVQPDLLALRLLGAGGQARREARLLRRQWLRRLCHGAQAGGRALLGVQMRLPDKQRVERSRATTVAATRRARLRAPRPGQALRRAA
mmetsp:Transcript_4888/g.15163  ORF Transcript_4888/g.15163 Transcript_4888/m.15163 type:complete len:293 (+) Transcript_4888:505-1383(+)